MEKRAWTTFILGLILSSQLSWAQNQSSTKTRRPPIDATKTLKVEYANPEWNLDSTKADTTAIVMRDSVSGRSVNVQLYETAPDSGKFRGYYNINWGDATQAAPEVYVPQKPIKDVSNQTQFELKNMRRLPFVLRKGSHGEQFIEVFNTRQEAVDALERYKAAAGSNRPSKDIVPSTSTLETAEQAQINALKKKEAEETLVREDERSKMGNLERKKFDELKKQFASLSPAERAKRKKLAEQQASTAMGFFQAGKFAEAEMNFRKASELDPENTSFYFGYGITLYRTEKNNESLVILKMADKGNFNPAERDFFIGLNHFKFKEYQSALEYFQKAKAANHPQISPSAAFYEGIVHFTEQRYEPAKNSFQEVLDTSSDPKLDQSAEDYIEKVQQVQAFLKNKASQFFVTGSLGGQYDSNVLLVNTADSGVGSASDIADTRTILGLGFQYRPFYNKEYEFSVKLKTDMLFSQKSSNVMADPFAYSLKLPYTYKGMLWGRGFKSEVTPGYEVLHLDVDSSGASKSFFAAVPDKENYLNTYAIDWANTLVMSENWFTSYNFRLAFASAGNGAGASATGDNDPGATTYKFNWNNMLFVNQKKTQAWIGDIGLSQSAAKGKNLTNNRLDASLTYMFPWVWELTGAATLSYYNASYSQKVPSKLDNNVTGGLNFIKPLNEWLKSTAGLGYTLNESDASASRYNKYTVTLMLMGDWSF